MICLILTIFSHIFQIGWIRGKESGGIKEHTFIALKPDGLQRGLVGETICRFEQKGFKLVGLKLFQASEAVLREHYEDLRGEPFFSRLLCYMGSGPVVAMVWQGLDVVKTSRRMLGETDPGYYLHDPASSLPDPASSLPDPASSLPDPASSLPGTIRGDFCIQVERNMIHSSESVAGAQREIALWFRPSELQIWDDCSSRWIYD